MNNEEKNKEKLAENKLIILYLLNKADCSLTNIQMQKLLYDVEDFNYFNFQHITSELINQNYVSNYKQGEEWLYEITPQGKEVLKLTNEILPGIIKHKLNSIIEENLNKVKNDVSITSEYIPVNDTEYITSLKINESHKVLFELNILCSSAEEAKQIADNWKKNASTLYPNVIKLLTE
ncbi:MAG: DUF4364 family protein [Clostridia bacterium]|nr:DUF4364 family protein [Clostridia bacterium]